MDSVSDQYVTETSAVVPGDYVKIYAELPLIIAISACPMGSGKFRAESGQRDTNLMVASTYRASHRPPPFAYPEPR